MYFAEDGNKMYQELKCTCTDIVILVSIGNGLVAIVVMVCLSSNLVTDRRKSLYWDSPIVPGHNRRLSCKKGICEFRVDFYFAD